MIGVIVAISSIYRDVTDFRIAQLNADVRITIDKLPNDTIGMCTTITGTTTEQPDGSDLWVAQTMHATGKYVFVRANHVTGASTWSAGLTVGNAADDGRVFELYAFYLPEDTSRFLQGLGASGNAGEPAYVYYTTLPDGVSGDPLADPVREATDAAGC